MLRMIPSHPMRFAMAFVALLFLSAHAAADTIVLKNGRRILALSAYEDGDKVKYLTSAGELSLPKSIVDHIEKGGAVPMANTLGVAAANLAIAPPTMQPGDSGGGEIERGAVHDGTVDRGYIAKLESEARSGGEKANLSAAIGHHAAATFEMSRGELEHALTDERTALRFAPEVPGLLLQIAYIHLRRSEYKQALEYLEQAVAEWKLSLALQHDREVQAALEKALQDKQEEESYKENESSHFKLRYNGAAEPALARDVLRTLEAHFSAIESELSYTPPESIGVILYTQEAFTDITRAPSWAGALYDGRIRVPVQGLTSVDEDLSRSLKHELTHSFIAQKTHAACMGLKESCAIRAPTWIQEGMAQWMEGQRSGENASVLIQDYAAGQVLPLGQLEGDWTRMKSDLARYAYAWALAKVEYIVQKDGMSDINRILDRIGSGMSTEAALKEVLHSEYSDLMQSTTEYLKKTYGR